MAEPRRSRQNPMAIDSLLNERNSENDSSSDNFDHNARIMPDRRPRILSLSPSTARPALARRETDPATYQPVYQATQATQASQFSYSYQMYSRSPSSAGLGYSYVPQTSVTYTAHSPGPTSPQRKIGVQRHRPKYTDEECFFLWYHMTDLGLRWDQVVDLFCARFAERQKSGLQCKFYRVLKNWGVPQVRAQRANHGAAGVDDDEADSIVGKYGVVERTNKRFSWMKLEHQTAPCLPQFQEGGSPTSKCSDDG